jgi:hypothetical protein
MDLERLIGRGLRLPSEVRHRTDPDPTPAPEPGPGGNPPNTPPTPPSTPPPPTTPPEPTTPSTPPSNADSAAQRLLKKAEKERDEAKAELQRIADSKKDETTREREKREAAERRADEADARADKALVKTRLLGRAAAKTSAVQAAVDLSEAKLLDLKEATDEELDAHLDSIVTAYQLPPAGGAPPQRIGTPGPGPQTTPGQGADAGAGLGGATGEPEKDYRGGVGRGILSIIGQRTGVQPQAPEPGE